MSKCEYYFSSFSLRSRRVQILKSTAAKSSIPFCPTLMISLGMSGDIKWKEMKNSQILCREIRKLLAMISRVTSERYPSLKYIGISNFLFLRFLVPAIATPAAYGVLKVKNSKKSKQLIALASKMQGCISASAMDGGAHRLSLELAVYVFPVCHYLNTLPFCCCFFVLNLLFSPQSIRAGSGI
jgi:hypothetical protein